MQNVAEQSALQDVNYLVVGLGLTGYSVARFLLAGGYRCRVQDTRDLPPYLGRLRAEFESFPFQAGEISEEMLDWADVLVVSPGLATRQPVFDDARARGKTLLGDVELFARQVQKPVVAITGSNGKSTVTRLVGNIIDAAGIRVGVGGNIGTPVLDLLAEPADYYVLELSSYQLETTQSLRPRVATILNLSEDHLDRYPGYDDYVEAKHRIYHNASVCVSNLDDPATANAPGDVCFSLETDSDAAFHLLEDDGYWLAHHAEPWLRVDDLKISGRHNWANCLAAMAIAHHLGIRREAIVEALCQFRGIPHRSQWVDEIDGVEWINDSKATNVGAALASIEGRDRPVILIAGGQSKGADMTVMAEALRQKVKLVLLLGEDADRLQQAWQGVTRLERVSDMGEAVRRANEQAVCGDCVLLAPACASFDMYEKFEARGDDFMQRVAELRHG